jgi:hypothetical protein
LRLESAAGEAIDTAADSAMARLARARANCISGRLGLALQDYDALLAGAARDFDSPDSAGAASWRPSP